MKNDGVKPFLLRMPDELHSKIKYRSVYTDQPMAEIMINAIKKDNEKYENRLNCKITSEDKLK